MQENITEAYQLSPQQKRLWQLQPDGQNSPYRVSCAIRISGLLDYARLQAALESVINQHEILRTGFINLPEMTLPLQVINPPHSPQLEVTELNNLPEAQLSQQLSEIEQSELKRPFNYRAGEVLHLHLCRVAEQQHLLLVSFPALVSDGQSLANFMEALAQAYSGRKTTEAESLQYVDFAQWQREILEAEETRAGRDYWQNYLHKAALNTPIPFEKANAPLASFEPKVFTRHIKATQLEHFGICYRSNPVEVLLACYQLLFWKLSDRAERVVGVWFDGRKYPELVNGLGLYARYLPLHLQVSDNLTFLDILVQTQTNKDELGKWQEYFSWEDLGEAEDYYGLLFDFTAQITRENEGLLWRTERGYECIERFKLRLSCHRQDDGLNLEFHYDPAYFPEEAIIQLAEHYETLLDNVIAAPQKPINTLEILSDRQREQILVDFNDTRAIDAPEATFHALFQAQAALTPETPALIYKEQSLTYAELNQQANQLAQNLQGLGVAPDKLVGLCFPRSCQMVVALLAIMKAGGAYLPLDPNLPYERLHFMLEDSGAVALVTTSSMLSRAKGLQDTLPVVCLDTFRAEYSVENPVNRTNPTNLAYSVYTSGSSGRPKGVLIEHRSPLNLLVGLEQSVYSRLPEKKFRASLNAPLSFDASMQQLILLLRGHTLVIIPEEIRSDGTALLKYLQDNRVESLDCTPSQLQILLDAGLVAQPYPKVVLAAGEAIEGRMWQTLTQNQPDRFFNIYGPTECTVDATCYPIKPQDGEPSIGKPLANYQVYVLDSEMNPLAIGVAGELHVGGVGLARGYLNRPDLTAQKFVPNPFSTLPGERLYKTGDLARFRPDGNLEFLGRLDQQVKIRGFRVELGEIEACLMHHPGVKEAVVLVQEYGEQRRLMAYLIGKPEAVASGELRNYASEKLPEYMVPVGYVWVESWPLNANGKLDRKALAEKKAEAETRVKPGNEAETKIAAVWQTVLGVSEVGVEDNFFDLGGHSLLLAQVQNLLQVAFERNVSMTDLFQYPTIRALANYLGQHEVIMPVEDSRGRAEARKEAMERQRRARKNNGSNG